MKPKSTYPDLKKPGTHGVWWHDENQGPLKELPFIRQFGHMKFTRINLDETMKPHLNDGIEIHYIESGKYDWVIEDQTVELYPDDISITAPWQKNGSPEGKMDLGEINWLVLKPTEFSLTDDLNLGEWTRIPLDFQKKLGEMIAQENGIILRNARNLKRYFTDLKQELTNQNAGYQMIVINLLENLMIALNRHLEQRQLQLKEDNSFIKTLTELILADLTKKWIVEELASDFGMGKTKFTDEVRRLTGYPPNSFIINLKLDKAKSYLIDDAMSLSMIAYSCGFSSLQHFTSTFSQRTGITPAAYRKIINK